MQRQRDVDGAHADAWELLGARCDVLFDQRCVVAEARRAHAQAAAADDDELEAALEGVARCQDTASSGARRHERAARWARIVLAGPVVHYLPSRVAHRQLAMMATSSSRRCNKKSGSSA
jgi:hypothetical protein